MRFEKPIINDRKVFLPKVIPPEQLNGNILRKPSHYKIYVIKCFFLRRSFRDVHRKFPENNFKEHQDMMNIALVGVDLNSLVRCSTENVIPLFSCSFHRIPTWIVSCMSSVRACISNHMVLEIYYFILFYYSNLLTRGIVFVN